MAENLILSENRTEIMERFGAKNYHLVYNTLSSISCISILYGFIRGRKQGPFIAAMMPKFYQFQHKKTTSVLVYGFRLMSLGIASQMFPALQAPIKSNEDGEVKARCPIDFANKDSPAKLITRHPMLWSMSLYGLSFALTATTQTQLIFNLCPMIFTLVGGLHQDSRFRRKIGGELDPRTSFVPFQSIITGEIPFEEFKSKVKGLNLTLGILLALIPI